MMYVATTKSVEIRCQKIQWIVSKYGVVATGIRIRILVMFRANSIAKAVTVALSLVFGFTFAVVKMRSRRR